MTLMRMMILISLQLSLLVTNKGKRRYAEATNYAKVLTGVYNGIPKGENGMIIKYQEPAQPINRRDAIRDYRPNIPNRIQKGYSS